MASQSTLTNAFQYRRSRVIPQMMDFSREMLSMNQIDSQGSWRSPTRPRIALYSHDTMGLGHKRRNRLLAETLAQSDLNADILMIMGAYELHGNSLPQGIDYLTLPGLYKEGNGNYRARSFHLPFQDVIRLRSKIIKAALKTFQPDIFIVDNVPRGVGQELNSSLRMLRWQSRTRCVLGLRDILDQPDIVAKEWEQMRNETAIRKYFDEVWVYGDRHVYDLPNEYHWSPATKYKVKYLGYLDQCSRLYFQSSPALEELKGLNIQSDPYVLCCVGGGQDGARLAQTFVETSLPEGMHGILLTGPFMPGEIRKHLQFQAQSNPCLHVLEYFSEPTLLVQQAQRVIAMGGYNTTCEILSFGKSALLVPRVSPRQEQWIRAQRLQSLDLLDVLHPDALSPQALSHWLHQDIQPPMVRDRLDLQGLDRFTQQVAGLLNLSLAVV